MLVWIYTSFLLVSWIFSICTSSSLSTPSLSPGQEVDSCGQCNLGSFIPWLLVGVGQWGPPAGAQNKETREVGVFIPLGPFLQFCELASGSAIASSNFLFPVIAPFLCSFRPRDSNPEVTASYSYRSLGTSSFPTGTLTPTHIGLQLFFWVYCFLLGPWFEFHSFTFTFCVLMF